MIRVLPPLCGSLPIKGPVPLRSYRHRTLVFSCWTMKPRFFAALLSSTILYIPLLGLKELDSLLAAVQRFKSLDLSSTMA
jgi:hypothetical protein